MNLVVMKGMFLVNALMGLMALNTLAMKPEPKHVWAYSTYWGTWDEVLDIVPSHNWGKEWVVKDTNETRVRTHATKQERDFITTKEPPKKPMTTNQAREWCKDTKDEALDILKDMGLEEGMVK